MPSKPLRFLYSKYAGQAPVNTNGNDVTENGGCNGYTAATVPTNNKQPTADNTIAQGQLQRLGREFTKSERINMFFAMSQNNYDGASQDYSSVGSASTNGRSIISRRERTLNISPVRFRSKSQEFQSKYKLAVTRTSPEHKLATLPQTDEEVEPSSKYDNSVDRLPLINSKKPNNNSGQNDGKVMEITMQTRNSVRKSVLPSKGLASHFNLDTTKNNNKNDKNHFKRPGSASSSNSFRSVQLRHHNSDPQQDRNRNRLLIDKIPRCQSGSPIDDDRLDSSHYQYLLNDFSSSSGSTIKSVKSDPASSLFSARAHRPSTTRTNSTNHLGTCSTDAANLQGTSTKTKSRHNSFTNNNKSPENQWPPRYSIIPSWPSYEDIQTLNTCGDHQNIITQLYRKESRWSRDRNSTIIYRNNHLTMKYPHTQQKQVHVVPSHTTMECAMCNLYSQRADPTSCPPNSPMVNCRDHNHDHQGQQSRMSNNYSVHVNHGTPTNNTAPSSVLSNKHHPTRNSSLSREPSKISSVRKESLYSVGDSNSSVPSRSMTANLQSRDKTEGTPTGSKRVSFSGKSNADKMAFTWDTCKVAYIKANV